MSSPAAIAFDAKPARTSEDLQTFWQAAPREAAAWASNVAHAAGLSGPALQKIDEALKGTDDAAIGPLLAQHPEIFKLLGNEPLQPPAAPTPAPDGAVQATQWIVDLAKAAPMQLVGRFQMGEGNVVKLVTSRGTYDVDLTKTSWREEVETAFFGRLMTVRGDISEDGTRIGVLDFSPGTNPHFISGRVQVNGDEVTISPGYNSNISVRVTDPNLKRLFQGDNTKNLVNYSPAGVILPGALETDEQGRLVYPHNPDGFYILGRVLQIGTEVHQDHLLHYFHTGYFRDTDAIAPADMVIPEHSQPGKGFWDPTDTTRGDTKEQQGRRTFFFVKIIPPDRATPFPMTRLRRIEVTGVLDAGDQGKHNPGTMTPARDLPRLAKHVPASALDNTEEGFAPPGAKPFVYA